MGTHLIRSIVTTKDCRDLVPVVADWFWDAFWKDSGKPFDGLLRAVSQGPVANDPIPTTFVCLIDGSPAGTASLIASDLDERPSLTPWLAGVFVTPDRRGVGVASELVRAVEAEARHAGVETLWLHTKTAEKLYAQLGWQTVERVRLVNGQTTLMRRHLVA